MFLSLIHLMMEKHSGIQQVDRLASHFTATVSAGNSPLFLDDRWRVIELKKLLRSPSFHALRGVNTVYHKLCCQPRVTRMQLLLTCQRVKSWKTGRECWFEIVHM